MSDNLREQFVQRVSSVGWGARESVQMLLGSVVQDLRRGVVEGAFTDDEVDVVIPFHDRAEGLWRDALSSNPPIAVDELIDRLEALRTECDGPLAHVALHVERALEHARTLEVMKKHR